MMMKNQFKHSIDSSRCIEIGIKIGLTSDKIGKFFFKLYSSLVIFKKILTAIEISKINN